MGENLKIKGFIKEHINAVLTKLNDVGQDFELNGDEITITRAKKYLPTNIKTQVYPGFPTDMQQVFTVLLTRASGESTVTETIYESRFKSAELLNQMGANTAACENVLTIKGPTELTGKSLWVPDLRGGAALLIAGLISEGTTILDNIPLLLRGYEDVVEKLKAVGAKIEIIE